MDDRHSAILWQLIQSLQAQDNQSSMAEPMPFEHTLLTLKPLMSPRQQRIIDLMIKMQEMQTLIEEIQAHH